MGALVHDPRAFERLNKVFRPILCETLTHSSILRFFDVFTRANEMLRHKGFPQFCARPIWFKRPSLIKKDNSWEDWGYRFDFYELPSSPLEEPDSQKKLK